VETCKQNAECLTFADGVFSHVNCQGVIHHTPNTEASIREIARVLRPGGSALISVYYKNIYLRSWPLLKFLVKPVSLLGAGMKGRGREGIYNVDNINEIVRMYDGKQNPIGKAYSKEEFIAMLADYFEIEDLFFHFFPARSLFFRIPRLIHKILDAKSGFMIFAKCKKKHG
jgi:SAM-dependent methyltransferase